MSKRYAAWLVGFLLCVAIPGASRSVVTFDPREEVFSGGTVTPHIETDGAGTWVAVFSSQDTLGGTIGSDDDILFVRSTDGGKTWSAAFPLNSDAATDAADVVDENPTIVYDGSSRWVAVWQRAVDTDDEDLFWSTSTDGGVTWSTLAQLTPANADRDQFPQLATDGSTWVVGYDGETVAKVATWSGAGSWSAPISVGVDFFDRAARVAVDDSGNWVAVFRARPGGPGTEVDVHFARSTDGGSTWSAPAAFATVGNELEAWVACDGTNFVAVWASLADVGGAGAGDRDILFSRSTDGGLTWTSPALLDSEGDSDSDTDNEPSLAADANGRFLAVWNSNPGGQVELEYTASEDGGATWSPVALVNGTPLPGFDEDGRAASDGSRWFVAWGFSGLQVARSSVPAAVPGVGPASWVLLASALAATAGFAYRRRAG